MPFFSVIVPTRNEEKRLGYCLPSLLNQSFQDFEIVIVEDPGTSDKTKEFVENLKSDKIKYIFHPKGMLMGDKRDYGTIHSTGEYFYFVDADMEFPSNLLQEIYDLIQKDKNEIIFVAEETPGPTWLNKMKNIEKTLAISNLSLSAARVYSKRVYQKIGGYDKTLIAGEDGNLSDRAMQTSAKFAITKTKVKHYETVGVNYSTHLLKKFRYGISSTAYFANQKKIDNESTSKDSVSSSNKGAELESRPTSSLKTYFFSPILWKNPFTAIQFVTFKFIELSVLATGLIYGKVFSKKVINTR
jgi:glycosyltransferase involved in cell wall biosynthesis